MVASRTGSPMKPGRVATTIALSTRRWRRVDAAWAAQPIATSQSTAGAVPRPGGEVRSKTSSRASAPSAATDGGQPRTDAARTAAGPAAR